ncbi:uncharacterized protein BYT42DRAFT_554937 [Radiomyces spectabilis]|uniref:uncharacterized protein n=1 Tax=Radiomyces spectabilis TaxID=64574 RepID=UPI0022211214|nr:uncharacterized protein BYT42DRAFT_554937 [Radiomyces spectabilis]KAI8390936.1 hypothetical protein BYT42DRAFT_554937 [Radiomyces spectabilis]
MSVPSLDIPQSKNWLPTLSSIILDNDSFAGDLIRAFDDRQLQLRAELQHDPKIALSNTNSIYSDGPDNEDAARSISTPSQLYPVPPTPSSLPPPPPLSMPAPAPPAPPAPPIPPEFYGVPPFAPRETETRVSAKNLLRRSSAYLRAKFEALRSHDDWTPANATFPSTSSQRQHPLHKSLSSSKLKRRNPHRLHAQEIFSSSSASLPPPSKIAINTTISLPQFTTVSQPASVTYTVKPPVITQYPPKPLKYSPVDPPDDTAAKSKAHRISLPLFNCVNHHKIEKNRRRSIAFLHSAKSAIQRPFLFCQRSNTEPRATKERVS